MSLTVREQALNKLAAVRVGYQHCRPIRPSADVATNCVLITTNCFITTSKLAALQCVSNGFGKR